VCTTYKKNFCPKGKKNNKWRAQDAATPEKQTNSNTSRARQKKKWSLLPAQRGPKRPTQTKYATTKAKRGGTQPKAQKDLIRNYDGTQGENTSTRRKDRGCKAPISRDRRRKENRTTVNTLTENKGRSKITKTRAKKFIKEGREEDPSPTQKGAGGEETTP